MSRTFLPEKNEILQTFSFEILIAATSSGASFSVSYSGTVVVVGT